MDAQEACAVPQNIEVGEIQVGRRLRKTQRISRQLI